MERLAVTIRALAPADFPALAAIQAEAPEASRWAVEEYARYEGWVAVADDGGIMGFVVLQPVFHQEAEILNLAVRITARRKGVARAMVEAVAANRLLYLEVRESNIAARALYLALGFAVSGRRRGYYENPPEDALLMTRQSRG